ncbi:hypothetical protein ACFL21_02930 [Patescibacteria group bacterium]
MNFLDLKNAIRFVQKTCPCLKCKNRYKQKDISILAATKLEALFEMVCDKCKINSVISVVLESDEKKPTKNSTNSLRKVNKISKNDILDIKNFLTNFDGNFKKIFRQ